MKRNQQWLLRYSKFILLAEHDHQESTSAAVVVVAVVVAVQVYDKACLDHGFSHARQRWCWPCQQRKDGMTPSPPPHVWGVVNELTALLKTTDRCLFIMSKNSTIIVARNVRDDVVMLGALFNFRSKCVCTVWWISFYTYEYIVYTYT